MCCVLRANSHGEIQEHLVSMFHKATFNNKNLTVMFLYMIFFFFFFLNTLICTLWLPYVAISVCVFYA